MLARLAARLLLPWIRFTIGPADATAQLGAVGNVCYVLELDQAADRLLLQRACKRARLPRPQRRIVADGGRDLRACVALTRKVGLLRQRIDPRPPPALRELLDRVCSEPGFELFFVPVSVYWGRAPRRERSFFKLVFAEDWVLTSRLRRLMNLVFNARNAVVQFGAPVSARTLAGGDPCNVSMRPVIRALQGQFAAARTAHVGPDLSHRRTLLREVLMTRAVRAAVAQQAGSDRVARRRELLNALELAKEIAANYSHAFVQFMAIVLRRVWTRIYDGVEFAHAQTLHEVAAGNEIVYVPCHRSHMDYILLSYAIYREGFAIPHIAAGVNLNLPVVGRFLRKGGGFFIRRSFRGSALYSVVFTQYLAAIMARGHSLEYFIEGGRSRSGRLLGPKTGMLSMTIRSYLREPVRPVVFVPVYFGYERIMEGESYVHELSGKPKQKETVGGFLRALRRLRERFGRVHVNLGEPIHLSQILDRAEPSWRSQQDDDAGRAGWINAAVDETAERIMRNINAAAAVTPVNLLATVLLSTPRHVLPEEDVRAQIDLCLRLLRRLPYSPRVTVTSLEAPAVLDYGYSLGIVTREESGGVVTALAPAQRPLMPYYRNNVLHLFALPSLLACCFIANASLPTADLQRLAWRIYPYIAAELFLRWDEDELEPVVLGALRALVDVGLLEFDAANDTWRRPQAGTAAAIQLSLLAQPTIQIVERYYLAIAELMKAGSGTLTPSELEKRCRALVQRMDTVYGLGAAEFFDRTLFDGFVALLRKRGVLRTDTDGRLLYDEVLERVASDAQLVLSSVLRHSVLQLTHD
ncbi:MAG: glycerol-3-phosphate 1-O-acyltransferase PlsB [Steroidobacteraceae bacterium]